MNEQPAKTDRQPEDPRLRFAAERTRLAWMRAGLALIACGFVVARFGLFLREIPALSNFPAAVTFQSTVHAEETDVGA